ncbi:MAG: hypothetical protein ACLSVD_05915 [Eggerthellaceae bacterium]
MSIIMIVLGVLVIYRAPPPSRPGVGCHDGMDQPMTLGDTETTADTTSVALGIIVLAWAWFSSSSPYWPARLQDARINRLESSSASPGHPGDHPVRMVFNGNWHIRTASLLIGNVIYLLRSTRRRGEGEHDLGIVGEAKASRAPGSQRRCWSSAPARGWPTISCAEPRHRGVSEA